MTRPLNAAARAKLKRDFEAIPKRMRSAARAQLHQTADEMVRQMKAAVPVVEGDLRDSIRKDDVSTESWLRVRISVGGPKTTRKIGSRTYDREVKVGQGDTSGRKKKVGGANVTYDYAMAIEYGTSDTAAQPFFRPTSRRLQKAGKQKLMRELRKAAKDV